VVAEQVGIPPEVLERARSLRPEGEGDATALLMSLRHKDNELTAELEEARRLREAAEERMAELEEMNERLREEKRAYRQQMTGEKERELTELRAQVERVIAKMPSKEEVLRARAAVESAQKKTASERTTEQQE